MSQMTEMDSHEPLKQAIRDFLANAGCDSLDQLFCVVMDVLSEGNGYGRPISISVLEPAHLCIDGHDHEWPRRAMTDRSPIECKYVERSGQRRGCTVCGGWTEKFEVLVEAKILGGTVRVCRECLKDGDLDKRLKRHAERMESGARWIRDQIGRLRVPTYEQWLAEDERVNAIEEEESARWWREYERKEANRSTDNDCLPF